MDPMTIPRTRRQIPTEAAARFIPVPRRELLDERFYIVEQLVTAPTHAARAAILLRIPDGVLIQMGKQLGDACREAEFAVGETYLSIRTSALSLTRDRDGNLPDYAIAELERWRRGFVMLAGRVSA